MIHEETGQGHYIEHDSRQVMQSTREPYTGKNESRQRQEIAELQDYKGRSTDMAKEIDLSPSNGHGNESYGRGTNQHNSARRQVMTHEEYDFAKVKTTDCQATDKNETSRKESITRQADEIAPIDKQEERLPRVAKR